MYYNCVTKMTNPTGLTPQQVCSMGLARAKKYKDKMNTLKNGAKVYKILWLILITITSCSIIITIALESVSLINLDTSARIAITVTIIIIQLIGAIAIAMETVFEPQKTSSECSASSKGYSELYREVLINIYKLKNDTSTEPREDLFQQMLYYSTREQVLILPEPLMLVIGYSHGVVDDDDINELDHIGDTGIELRQLIMNHPSLSNDDKLKITEYINRQENYDNQLKYQDLLKKWDPTKFKDEILTKYDSEQDLHEIDDILNEFPEVPELFDEIELESVV